MVVKILIISLITLLFLVSTFGWGRLFEKAARLRLPWAFTLVHGLGVFLFLGGILNFLGIAYTELLDAIVIIGCGVSIFFVWVNQTSASPDRITSQYFVSEIPNWLLPTLFILAAVVYVSITQVPAQAFNYHDDFEKYLVFPVRMLATGTLSAGPFTALGSETLGGKSFLDGFVVSHFPIAMLNVVDSLFGMLLCLLLLTSLAQNIRVPRSLVTLFPILLFAINPQIVNTSSTYTGIALFLLLFAGPIIQNDVSKGLPALSVGIIYAGLIALKPTFLLPVLIHFLMVTLLIFWSERKAKPAIDWSLKSGSAFLLFLAPWLLTHMTVWIGAWDNTLVTDPLAMSTGASLTSVGLKLFSLDPLFWGFGAYPAHYTGITLVIAICAVIIITLRRSGITTKPDLFLLVAVTVPLISFIIINLFLSNWLGRDQALRFITPVLIAGAPVAIGAIYFELSENNLDAFWTRALNGVSAIMIAGIIVAFIPSTISRVQQALQYGNVLSFGKLARSSNFLDFNKFVLSKDTEVNFRGLQNNVPEGEPLMVWTAFPFVLDYARNPIFDIQPAGLATPWMDFPLNQELDAIVDYLKGKNIQYVLWQYKGYSVRSAKQLRRSMVKSEPSLRKHYQRTLMFNQSMEKLGKNSQILFNNGTIVLFRIPD